MDAWLEPKALGVVNNASHRCVHRVHLRGECGLNFSQCGGVQGLADVQCSRFARVRAQFEQKRWVVPHLCP